jgi:hypothetical protein
MRILLTHHAPLRHLPPGWFAWHSAQALAAAGHEVRLLVGDWEHRFGESLEVERVVCGEDPNADLTFSLPRFTSEDPASNRVTFAELSDGQLARYRDCQRRRLDNLILHFDPHMIHCQHVWLLGQLALESGVPYVLSAWETEFIDLDARFRPLAEQAAENAGRIYLADEPTRRRMQSAFDLPEERLETLAGAQRLTDAIADPISAQQVAAELTASYQQVLKERFG